MEYDFSYVTGDSDTSVWGDDYNTPTRSTQQSVLGNLQKAVSDWLDKERSTGEESEFTQYSSDGQEEIVKDQQIESDANDRLKILAKKYADITNPTILPRADVARLEILEARLDSLVPVYSDSELEVLEGFTASIQALMDGMSREG